MAQAESGMLRAFYFFFGLSSDQTSPLPVTSRRPCSAGVKQSDNAQGDDRQMTDSVLQGLPRISINRKIPRPVRLDVLEAATALPGKATQLLIGILLLVAIRQAPTVSLTRRTMARVSVSRYAASDALKRLENANIISVWRLPGRSSMVTILEPGTRRALNLSTT